MAGAHFFLVFLAFILFNSGNHKHVLRQCIYTVAHVHSELVQGFPAVWLKSDFDDSRLTTK